MYGQDMAGGEGRTDVPIKYYYFVSVELSLYPLPFLKCGAKIQNIFVSNNISNVFLMDLHADVYANFRNL